ncbi:MBL fold metallo-hydrolase [Ruania zhangjianzhongii]|uniref:MBL fold metallo-hydrolase n=1 Tax=Ruania zhangjianzhongii TaxID=2603206 RepID=UPI0011D22F5D|nr:MBL fold metallo-hydrolase [Ruania zhangjianzhongii]
MTTTELSGSNPIVPGHVQRGGPTAVWRTANAEVHKASVSAMDNNAYLIVDRRTGDHLLIDAADDATRLQELLAAEAATGSLVGILTTHRHPDHHGALAELVASTGAPVLAGGPDADQLRATVDHRLGHGDQVTVGSLGLHVVALRGHTPGSVALVLADDGAPPLVFTGDSLFPGGVGKTGSAADFQQLIADVTERVFAVLPDETVVLPGHGDNTTLGAQRPALPEWRARGW